MSYNHLTMAERGMIEALQKQGLSMRQTAHQMGRSASTISREWKRNKTHAAYKSERAHAVYLKRRKACKPEGRFTFEMGGLIAEGVFASWSPEQIENGLKRKNLDIVCFKTIYTWIDQGRIEGVDRSMLREKGKRRQTASIRAKYQMGTSIHERAAEIDERSEFGHFEADSVLSSRGGSKACVATFIERKSRMYIAVKTPDRTADSMKDAIQRVVDRLPKGTVKTMTSDRGKEFARYAEIEKAHLRNDESGTNGYSSLAAKFKSH